MILQGTSLEEKEGTLKSFFDKQYLIQHFDESFDLLQCDFSFTVKEKVYWIRFVTMKAVDYSLENRKVMLYYSDITDIKNKQLLLEKEEKQKKYQLEHDPLTGAYNRRGYDEILKQHESDYRPMAYIQLDIDNFKKLNDTYGHAFGDEVLKQVAVLLKNAFRADDYVFRFGGDEFAVLLTNCTMDVCNNISYKQSLIHIRLNQILKKGVYVTLSMGISWSDSGFKEELVAIADAALYKTKSNGRAGCCVFDSNYKAIYEWKDVIGNNIEGSPLDQSYTGACRIELPGGQLSQGRLICNETARVLMGFDASMTPEICFQTWLKRVDPHSRVTITKTRKAMLEKGQAECMYIYHHPLQDTRIVLQEDDSRNLVEAIIGLYFTSYYISLQDDWFWIFKTTKESKYLDKQDIPAAVEIQHFVQSLVKPEYREKIDVMKKERLPMFKC